MYFENEKLTDLTAGAPAEVKKPTLLGWSLESTGAKGLTDNPSFIIFCLVMLVACCWFVLNVRRTGTGRRFLAVRANERAAAASGINVSRTKLLAFGVASGLAGVAGTLLAFQQKSVSSSGFIFQLGFPVLAFAYLAGITSINGAIVGGLLAPVSIVAVVSAYFFHDAKIEAYQPILGGIGLVVTAIIHPEGIAPFFQPLTRHAGNWLRNARGPEWASFVRRYVPWMVGGAIAFYLLFPLRVDSYSKFWMPLLGAIVTTLFLRAPLRALFAKVTGKQPPSGGHGAHGQMATTGEVA
jgi:branched-chain amino acid transport system permease protein